MKEPLSMRRRLLSATALGLLLVLTSAGLVLERGGRRALYAQFDRELAGTARLLASAGAVGPRGLDLGLAGLDLGEFAAQVNPGLLQISLASGAVLYASPSLEGHAFPQASGLREGEPRYSSLRGPRSNRMRAVELSFRPRVAGGGPATADAVEAPLLLLTLARGTRPLDEQLAKLRLALLLVGGAAVGIGLLIQAAVLRRALSPLQRLGAQIGVLSPDRPAARLGAAGAPPELAPAIGRLNDLLVRFEAALGRK